jgi:tagaturonate reductase
MKLSIFNLKNITPENLRIPDASIFELPEKVLQFGTGVLLRGLPDYFIDKANRMGIFGGRIVVVKSTRQGDTSAFNKQDGLYTVCVRGIEGGEKVEENIINASISRVLDAHSEWAQILECAHNRNMQVIISNTTEVGIQLEHDNIRQHPPHSYPGKLLAFLYERFKAFEGSKHSGLVILPTELITDNGKKLESIVLELAHLNSLEDAFIEWLETYNYFCNTLVDRIVPGKPDAQMLVELNKELGYDDDLLTMAEVYRLWAIEGGEEVANLLTFAKADAGVIIKEDIQIYRELKLRLLNGTHTLSCGLAFLAYCDTVKTAMDNETVSAFIYRLMMDELAPSIPYDVSVDEARAFGEKVLDRFRNPHIKHQWISITMQYSSKMKMRCLPLLLHHYTTSSQVPESFALGFAAYLAFTHPVQLQDNKYYGTFEGGLYVIQDDQAAQFYSRWQQLAPEALVAETLKDVAYWGADLSQLPHFQQSVTAHLQNILSMGMMEAIHHLQNKKEIVA